MDIWSWMSELPSSGDDWHESSLVFELANDGKQLNSTTDKSILLKAEKSTSAGSNSLQVTFSVCIQGFEPYVTEKTLWVSNPCSLSSEQPYLPLLLQLIQEIIIHAPNSHESTCPRSQHQKLKPEPVSWIIDSHSPESLSHFFNFIFLCRIFWICVCDAPSEVGSVYFHKLLAPNLNLLSCKHVIRNFFISIGIDGELCIMRTLGYMLANWHILRDLRVGLQMLTPLPSNGFSYASESHGFWVLKGYAPVLSMQPSHRQNSTPLRLNQFDTKETVLKYVLAHQQLEATIQLQYSVYFTDGFIQVNARIDNLRFHMVKLGFNKNEEANTVCSDERHFPSRIRIWAGPEIGANYVSSLSLGRSTENQEREVETKKAIKGSTGKLRGMAKTTARRKTKSWRFDQDAEGHAAIFEAVLCDNATGLEVSTWKANKSGDEARNPMTGLKNRYNGASRLFNKAGGLVLNGDEYGEGVGWRLNRDMEGSVLKWRLGGKIWVSYCPNSNDLKNDSTTSTFETRCVNWCEEVDLPLIRGKLLL